MRRIAPRRTGLKLALVIAVVVIFAGAVVVLTGSRTTRTRRPTPRHSPQIALGTPTATATNGQSPSTSPTQNPTQNPTPARSPTPSPTRPPPSPSTAPSPASPSATPPAGSDPSGQDMPTGDIPGWHLVFSDDFNGTSLDTNAWGAYNGHPQGDPGGFWDPSHVLVQDGMLQLLNYRDPAFGNIWVSGGVSSAPGLKQTYGKYLVRYRIEKGYGIAGIVLLWPSTGGWPPEIDFAEDGGGNRTETTATLHYGPNDTQIARTTAGDFTQWHTIGVEWTPGRIVYTLDGAEWGQVSTSQVPSGPMEMDIQTQAGTCGQIDTPCPDATTPDRVTMQVDWVVAYRPA